MTRPTAPPAPAGINDIAETLDVNAPIQQVWDVLADTSRYAEWVEDCLAVTYHHGPAALGGIYRERNLFLGPIRVSTTWTVTELEAPFYRRDTGVGMPLVSDLEAIFELESLTRTDGPEATRWTYRNRYRVGLGALGRRIDGLQQGELRTMMRASMGKLAELVLASPERPAMSGDWAAAARRVVDTARLLAAGELVLGSAGNVSERCGDHVAITATGAKMATLEVDQVSIVDLHGHLVDGQFEPTSELDLHLGVYHRYSAGAVIHTHAPMACAVSCVLEELPCVHYQMLALGGPIRVAPYRTFGTPDLADVTLDALEGRSAALMANHGAIVYADGLDRALEQTRLLEWACTVYWRAAAIGTPQALDAASRTAVIEAAITRNYGTPKPVER